ncbi:hypothetical protein C8J56DRAFT_19204 [Mycena floridula]|nr:hypothetical protein C8J56DRAFT_19204 [Mycena floridula]
MKPELTPKVYRTRYLFCGHCEYSFSSPLSPPSSNPFLQYLPYRDTSAISALSGHFCYICPIGTFLLYLPYRDTSAISALSGHFCYICPIGTLLLYLPYRDTSAISALSGHFSISALSGTLLYICPFGGHLYICAFLGQTAILFIPFLFPDRYICPIGTFLLYPPFLGHFSISARHLIYSFPLPGPLLFRFTCALSGPLSC